ncbi:MAG TPA: hypothetical protein VGM73_06205 [Candidatus Didemnitutus sp.]
MSPSNTPFKQPGSTNSPFKVGSPSGSPFKTAATSTSPFTPASEHRQLMMRANRLLGSALIEHNLVKFEDLEVANERLLELSAQGDFRQASVLGILVNEKKVLREEDLIQLAVEEQGLGAVDLRHYDVPDDLRRELDLSMCWATWTVPYDREEDFHFVATAYSFSQAVRTHWEKKLQGPVIWQVTSMEVIADFLDRLQVERDAPVTKPSPSRAPFSPS